MPFQIGPLATALVFSAVFVFGSDGLIPAPLRCHQRKLLSFGAGVSIAYVFVYLLPELETARAVLARTGADRALPFPALRVYLAALCGFMLFYGLEHLVQWTGVRPGPEAAVGEKGRTGRAIRTGGFLAYVWLAGYLAVRSLEERPTPLVLYTVALGLHFLSLDFLLGREYGPWYRRSARYAFAIAPVAGWLAGLFVGFSQLFTAALLGFVSGGIIMNTIVSELPKEKEGRLLFFLLGGAIYTVLLIVLS